VPVFKIWAIRLRPTRPRAAGLQGPEGPIGSYVVSSVACVRTGRLQHGPVGTARVVTGVNSRPGALPVACAVLPGEAAQVGGGAHLSRQLECFRDDETDRPDPRTTPPATYRRCRGPVHSIATCPDGQHGEWSPPGRSWSPCMGVAQISQGPTVILVRPGLDPTQTPICLPLPAIPLAPKGHHAATHSPWGSIWASGAAVDRKVAQMGTLSARRWMFEGPECLSAGLHRPAQW
jgi:hypothetical protein